MVYEKYDFLFRAHALLHLYQSEELTVVIFALQGGEKYQAAYYVFEELAQASATQAVHSLLGQAVSELHLGRIPEAEAAFQQAIDIDPKNPELLANLVVLNTVLGKDAEGVKKQLETAQPKHQLLVDLAAKREAFESAREKYTPKFEP